MAPVANWLVKFAKSHAFCAFEANFMWKMENSPPHSKTAPPPFENSTPSNVWICEIGRNSSLNFGEDLYFFLEITWFWAEKTFEFRISAEKSLWILAKTFFFFFFRRSPNFGRKKPLNFRAFRSISPQVSGKPSEIDSRSIKIRVKVVCTLLTLSK